MTGPARPVRIRGFTTKARLTPRPVPRDCPPFHQISTMGQQYNKHIKKKRRLAYLKRKKEAAKTAAKKPAAKAKK